MKTIRKKRKGFVLFVFFLPLYFISSTASSHQPVMDMAPRWEGGLGFQVRHEYRFSDDAMEGDSDVDNPFGRKRRVNKTWIEGVYTFRREARVTFKLPWVDQKRTSVRDDVSVMQEGQGFGDLIVAVPLKIYQNRAGITQNTGFTPSVRLPTGNLNGGFSPGDGSIDFGFSLSHSVESFELYQFYDVFYWLNQKGTNGINEGDELGFDANIGIHPLHNNVTNSGVFLMLDARVRHKQRGRDEGGDTGGTRLSLGPVFVYYKDNMMFRAELHFPVYERVSGSQVSFGNEINIGIGYSF